MKSISEAYIARLQESNTIDELGIMKIRYALAVLRNELVKTLLLTGIFALSGQLGPFLLVMFLILPIRLSTGGIHFKDNISCFVFSLGYFLAAICLLPLLALPIQVYWILLGCGILVSGLCPLAPSERRPIKSRKKYLQNKYFSLVYLFFFAVLLLVVIRDEVLVAMNVWALILHSVEMLFLKWYKRKEGHHYV
ncbi:accessory gene regulator B family protein [Aminipila butyrica]|uniref:Accessory gene regulator B family protein n=1 Tax=Aminipila butyrica TaxID=433296 RepID=A0A858BUM7_9FIRM|nr:accessory gene regulator B family protein [Aminipila butyrica]QIB68484.1 accessory gene regulator B family protein [Aminipila butyrica]